MVDAIDDIHFIKKKCTAKKPFPLCAKGNKELIAVTL